MLNMDSSVIGLVSYFRASLFMLNIFFTPGTHASSYCLDPGYTPNNGSRTPAVDLLNKYFLGAVIRYECNDQYKLNPNQNTQTCELNAQQEASWLPEKPPTCIEVAVCLKPNVLHATISKEIFHEGEYLNDYFSCDSGYTLAQKENYFCLESGEWSNIPSCIESNCVYPPMIQDGFFNFYSPKEMANPSNEEWPPGTSVFYECISGYELEPASQRSRVCMIGIWSGPDPECVRNGCSPPDPSEGDYIPKLVHYEIHNTITYICSYDDHTRTCEADHTWSGTPCPDALTTQQMPYTPNHNANVYCTTPPQVLHGSFECCSKEQVTNAGSTEKDVCCPVRGVIEFVCNEGYTTKDDVTQWICGTAGEWISLGSGELGTPIPPTCFSNTTRQDPDPMPDEILKPVISVAAGVFLILSVAIIIAFCRPKIKDMKRRWRKLREDDDEIIIDGRRILLPSYEEAVTSSNPCLAQITEPRSTSSDADDGPSTSHGYDNVNIVNTRDDTSMIFQVHRESVREHPRNCSSSDEEMLVPNITNSHENIQVKSEANNSVSQPLILTAGTSVDDYVLINKPSNENFNKINAHTKESNEKGETQSNNWHDPITNFLLSDVGKTVHGDLYNDQENDFDTNLESIFPKTILMPENNRLSQPPPINEGLNLLSYPIMPLEVDNKEHCEHEPISICIEPGNINLIESDSTKTNLTTVKNEENGNLSEREDYEPIITNSDHVHIVMSQTSSLNKDQQQQDETGSTTV